MKDRESQKSTETKPKKKKLGRRVGERLRNIGDAGRESVQNPKSIPGRTGNWFKRWLGELWKVRGGGLYAVGYIVCFIYFEVQTAISEVTQSGSVNEFFANLVSDFLFRFLTETLGNMIKSFIWPVYVVGISPPYGAIALGFAFWLFPKYLKKPIERWLFGGELTSEKQTAE